MDDDKPSKPYRFVESLYDLGTGKTIVRHPRKDDAWSECSLLPCVLRGQPVASVSGPNECEVFTVPPDAEGAVLETPKQMKLMITFPGHIGILRKC